MSFFAWWLLFFLLTKWLLLFLLTEWLLFFFLTWWPCNLLLKSGRAATWLVFLKSLRILLTAANFKIEARYHWPALRFTSNPTLIIESGLFLVLLKIVRFAFLVRVGVLISMRFLFYHSISHLLHFWLLAFSCSIFVLLEHLLIFIRRLHLLLYQYREEISYFPTRI